MTRASIDAPLIRLVLSDIDGTLCPFAWPRVPERSLDAVDALREEGIFFGPATGRPIGGLIDVFSGETRYLANGVMNGGKQVMWDGEPVYEQPLEHVELSHLCDLLGDMDDAALIIYCDDPKDRIYGSDGRWCIVPFDEGRFDDLVKGFASPLELRPLVSVPDEDIFCADMFCTGDGARCAELVTLVERECPGLELVSPGMNTYDVNPRGWNKAGGLGVLLGYTGICLDQVVFMGDSDNDVTMMRSVPHSFCVEGGSDAALEAASGIIPSAEDFGPALLMESLVRNHGRLVMDDVVVGR